MEYYSAIKMNEILPLAVMWMDLRNTMFSEISQTENEKCFMISLICEILKKIQMNVCAKQKQIHRYKKQSYGTSLVVWWLGLHLPVQGIQVQFLVR